MKKISDFSFILFYILSVSFLSLLISINSTSSVVISADSSEESLLQMIYPVECSSSPTLSAEYSCENLYDSDFSYWSDNKNSCSLPTWIQFTFKEDIFLEFIVIQNVERSDLFNTRYNIQDFRLRTYNEEIDESPVMRILEDDTIPQWFDINEKVNKIKIEVFSVYPPKEDLGINDTESCVLQEVTFYGRNL